MTEKDKPAGISGAPDNEATRQTSSSQSDYTMGTETEQYSRDLALWNLARAAAGCSDYNQPVVETHWPTAPLDDAVALRDWLRDNPSLAVALARVDPETPPPRSISEERYPSTDAGPGMAPPLPGYAALSSTQVAQAAEAGTWLDDYIGFASQASPMTPRSFHEAAGLFAGSLAIARRLCLKISVMTIYPNLYLLFIGRSTLPRKTTGMRVLRGLLTEADMELFLLTGRQTPEALLLDLSTRFPPTYDEWPNEERAAWLRERAFAAQRGWQLEEASHLLDSFNRDYSSGLLPIVLDLHDCHEQGPGRNTVSRGRERVEQPYLSIFGATTFGAVGGHLNEAVHWHNGLWARFALVSSDGHGDWQFFPDEMEYPRELVERLQVLAYEQLPVPEARLVARASDDDREERQAMEVQVEALSSTSVQVSRAAWDQWEWYSKAVGFDMLHDRVAIPERLEASYGRLGTMVIKVAIILAALDAHCRPVRVEPKHVYRAQIIVEGWRESLHRIFLRGTKAERSGQQQRVLRVLGEHRGCWVTQRDLLRSLGLTLPALKPVIESLDGRVEVQAYKPERGPSSVQYRLSEGK
jgi:hypothetical protein